MAKRNRRKRRSWIAVTFLPLRRAPSRFRFLYSGHPGLQISIFLKPSHRLKPLILKYAALDGCMRQLSQSFYRFFEEQEPWIMKNLAAISLFAVLISGLLLTCLPSSAQQTTGQIDGTIFDAQGAAVVGAEITATNPNTGFKRTATSSAAGTYSLPLLPPGTYSLTVKAKGFAGVEQKGISI